MAKKYYWLKLRNDWFGDKRIKKLRSIAGGDTYTIIYLKMQLLSLKNEGKLFLKVLRMICLRVSTGFRRRSGKCKDYS